MKSAHLRPAVLLPAIALGLVTGFGINAWRHRQDDSLAQRSGVINTVSAVGQSAVRPAAEESGEVPPADAAAFLERFNGVAASSPLRSQLARESLAAGLTLEAFLTLLGSDRVPHELWSSDALPGRFREWAAGDRGKIIDLALDLPESARRGCLNAALKGLGAAEFRAFMGKWADEPRLTRTLLFGNALAAVARKDAAGALALLSELPLDKKEKEALTASTYSTLLQEREEQPAEWGQVFQLVMETARSLPPDKLDAFLHETFSGMNTARAAAAWPAVSDAAVSPRVQREFLQKWAQSDPGTALAKTVEHFPPASADAEARRLYGSLATQAAVQLQLLNDRRQGDPQAYLALAEKVPPGPGHDAFLTGLVDQAASGNPALAVQLLPQVPEANRAQTINTIAELWTAKDAVAASEWVASLPPGAGRDTAAGGLVRRLAESDPERAAQWAVSIQNESDRREALKRVQETWHRLDPAAAARWEQSRAGVTPTASGAGKP